MKSELVPGYEFEFTLDNVLKDEYSKYFHANYSINSSYIRSHLEELLKLRNVLIPTIALTFAQKETRKRRHMDDLNVDGKLGLYQWYNLFSKLHRGQNYEDTKEDHCRMLLDLVKKYPEHSEIIQLKLGGEPYVDFSR
ncbi:hypothetical protein [Methanobrevibacter sp.]|uniref:hypothetical protein n=1 Tax=Methanobrevibacter sp. TaxID=66852 RepID=UPI00386B1D02